MKIHGLCLFVLLSATTFLAAQPSSAADKEYEKKIKALQDQIDELRKQQDALRKEKAEQGRAQKAKLEAEQAEHFAKVEIRGKLGKAPAKTIVYDMGRPITPTTPKTDTWHVAVKSMIVPVNFRSKALRELAEQHAGKEVIIHGSIDFGTTLVPSQRVVDGFGWPALHDVAIPVTTAAVQAETLKLAKQPKPKPDQPAKERAVCPYDHQKMKTEGVLWRHDPLRPVPMLVQVTTLAPDQKVVAANSRHLLTEASIHAHFRPTDVYLPDEKLKKLAQELNGRRVEIVGEFRRLVILPKSFGDLSTGTSVPAGKGKSLWVPDRDEVTMPTTRLIIWATDLKPIGPKLESILGGPSSKTPFGNGEWLVYTIQRLPKGKDLTAVRILRDDTRVPSP